MVTSAVLYLVAMTAHAAEWASVRTAKVTRPVPAMVGAPAEAPGPEVAVAVDGRRTELLGRIGLAVTVVAALTHVAGVVLRGVAAQRAPWGNMYEFVTTSLAIVAIVYLVLALRSGMRWLGLPVTLLLTIGQGLAVTVFYVDVSELMPALHSVWFVIHIIAAATAGAAFNVGGIAAILYLVRTRAEARGSVRGYLARIPSAAALDRVSYRFHAFAFPLWTFTIAAGAIWAQFAWGRFWGWDPKETWSLVTWIVYAVYLHARATAGWKGRRAAVVAVVGLATFWFNFIGINLLVSGLHSYAGI
ncbi:MAG: c-type cytochrome biogenesis protein CcsB [Actinobacteria bacterium]|nr:c-type cytochrome biogenesis protein CcsB [Actinomycetota bacterium]